MDEEEPLAEWARKRAQRREQRKGRLRAVPLTLGPHLTVGVADDWAAAKVMLHPPEPFEEQPAEWDRPPAPRPLAEGRGRHRRPAEESGR